MNLYKNDEILLQESVMCTFKNLILIPLDIDLHEMNWMNTKRVYAPHGNLKCSNSYLYTHGGIWLCGVQVCYHGNTVVGTNGQIIWNNISHSIKQQISTEHIKCRR